MLLRSGYWHFMLAAIQKHRIHASFATTRCLYRQIDNCACSMSLSVSLVGYVCSKNHLWSWKCLEDSRHPDAFGQSLVGLGRISEWRSSLETQEKPRAGLQSEGG